MAATLIIFGFVCVCIYACKCAGAKFEDDSTELK